MNQAVQWLTGGCTLFTLTLAGLLLLRWMLRRSWRAAKRQLSNAIWTLTL